MPESAAVELVRVEPGERAGLEELLDAYLIELAAHREVAVGATRAGSYRYLPLYWREPGWHPFFLVSALIRELAERGSPEMSAFGIRPEARRCGLGRAAVAEIWRCFPGVWELEVHVRNRGAIAFWQRCIESLATGSVRVDAVERDDERRMRFCFRIAVSG